MILLKVNNEDTAMTVLVNFENIQHINPFHTIGLYLYPLKTPENQKFSEVFRGYR